MNYKGIIIEESLSDKSVLDKLKILETKVELTTERHKTPWLKQWTLHTVEVPEKNAENLAKQLSESIDQDHDHSWYADFNNDKFHFVIFPNKVFKIPLGDLQIYEDAKQYGVKLGIPMYQLDFEQLVRKFN